MCHHFSSPLIVSPTFAQEAKIAELKAVEEARSATAEKAGEVDRGMGKTRDL